MSSAFVRPHAEELLARLGEVRLLDERWSGVARLSKGTLAGVLGGLAVGVVLLSQVTCTQVGPTAAQTGTPAGPPARGQQADERTPELLRAAEAYLDQAGSVNFDMNLRIQIESAEAQVGYTGVFQTPDRSRGTIGGFPIEEMEILKVGDAMYARALPGDGWTRVGFYTPYFLDPARIIGSFFSGHGDFELAGEDDLDGTPAHHLKGTIAPGLLTENSGEIAVELWVGRSGPRLLQVSVKGSDQIGAEGHSILGGLGVDSVDASATIRLSGAGKPTSIEAPSLTAMREGRGGLFTATALMDGSVLVTGGERFDLPVVLKSADIYDPRSGYWTSLPNMGRERGKHTATLLEDGRVLVAGGVTWESGLNTWGSCELYDPATGHWTAAASMPRPRYGHIAFRLQDGRVLAAGGWSSQDFRTESAVTSAEIYDPATDTWTPTGEMNRPRGLPMGTVLPDGRVLVAGGILYRDRDAVESAEIYDPRTGRWMETASMSSKRGLASLTLLPDGRVLVAGGVDGKEPVASAEIYDPGSGTWSRAAPMGRPRFWHWAALLQDGRVLVSGSWFPPGELDRAAEAYDPATDSWVSTGAMIKQRGAGEAVVLPDGRVIAVGGSDGDRESLASSEVYDPTTARWALPSPAP